jgi:hypothetical protein
LRHPHRLQESFSPIKEKGFATRWFDWGGNSPIGRVSRLLEILQHMLQGSIKQGNVRKSRQLEFSFVHTSISFVSFYVNKTRWWVANYGTIQLPSPSGLNDDFRCETSRLFHTFVHCQGHYSRLSGYHIRNVEQRLGSSFPAYVPVFQRQCEVQQTNTCLPYQSDAYQKFPYIPSFPQFDLSMNYVSNAAAAENEISGEMLGQAKAEAR